MPEQFTNFYDLESAIRKGILSVVAANMASINQQPELGNSFWPASLAHLAAAYLLPADEYVVVGEVSSEAVNGYQGNRLVYTAIVPCDQAEEVLNAAGGIGHGVHANGPRPCPGLDAGFDSSFWIAGPQGTETRFETLIHSWRIHNREVLVPDNGFLMCYGLTPGVSKDGTLVWHDLSIPVYGVVRVRPESVYTVQAGHTTARIEILRDYLEDFLSLKGSVAIATQFEERFSTGDPLFDGAVGNSPGRNLELTGRYLWLKRMSGLQAGDQLSQVWCARLILRPTKRPVSDDEQKSLKWPDRAAAIVGTGHGQEFGVIEKAFIRDEVLVRFENRPEFTIYPESGGVSYGGWWAVGRSRRVGRDFIALELRKLYEGTPFSIIEHYCEHAVAKDCVAEAEEEINIGIRAKRLIDAYLSFVAAIQRLCDAMGLSFSEEEVGSYSTTDVNYQGWCTISALARLGNVSSLSMSYPDFLSRCKDIYRLLEGIKPAPLRNLLRAMGIDKERVNSLEALKLAAAICQLANLAKVEDYRLLSDHLQIAAKWNKEERLECFAPLFALYGLRQADAHTASRVTPQNQSENLKVFSIDIARFQAGWGRALDRVYDLVAQSLEGAEQLIESAPR